MKVLLDTAPLAAYTRGRAGAVARLDALIQHHEAAASIISYGEVIEGLYALPAQFTLLLPDYPIMERYAAIRRTMRPMRTAAGQPGGLIGDLDTLIAATALEHGLTIITTDNDFTRVPGLVIQLLTMAQLRDP